MYVSARSSTQWLQRPVTSNVMDRFLSVSLFLLFTKGSDRRILVSNA